MNLSVIFVSATLVLSLHYHFVNELEVRHA